WCALIDQTAEFIVGKFGIEQRDVRDGKNAILITKTPVFLEPFVESMKYLARSFGVILERLAVMDRQGVGATLLFPTLGVGMEEALKDDPEAAGKVFSGFNLWLEDDWGYCYQNRIFAVPNVPLLDPQF